MQHLSDPQNLPKQKNASKQQRAKSNCSQPISVLPTLSASAAAASTSCSKVWKGAGAKPLQSVRLKGTLQNIHTNPSIPSSKGHDLSGQTIHEQTNE